MSRLQYSASHAVLAALLEDARYTPIVEVYKDDDRLIAGLFEKAGDDQ